MFDPRVTGEGVDMPGGKGKATVTSKNYRVVLIDDCCMALSGGDHRLADGQDGRSQGICFLLSRYAFCIYPYYFSYL